LHGLVAQNGFNLVRFDHSVLTDGHPAVEHFSQAGGVETAGQALQAAGLGQGGLEQRLGLIAAEVGSDLGQDGIQTNNRQEGRRWN
jgi:hypothetical protein